jgi:branched-subunit amino acid transport protein
MKIEYILFSTMVMALTTYAIRAIPMVVFRKKITNIRIKSFLYYVPYTVLAAMTFPGIFDSTGTRASAIVGCIVALILAYFKRGLLVVALGASGAALIMQLLGF